MTVTQCHKKYVFCFLKIYSLGVILSLTKHLSTLDIALKIVDKYPELGTGTILFLLAQKPEAFREEKNNIILRTIKLGKHIYFLASISYMYLTWIVRPRMFINKEKEPAALRRGPLHLCDKRVYVFRIVASADK